MIFHHRLAMVKLDWVKLFFQYPRLWMLFEHELAGKRVFHVLYINRQLSQSKKPRLGIYYFAAVELCTNSAFQKTIGIQIISNQFLILLMMRSFIRLYSRRIRCLLIVIIGLFIISTDGFAGQPSNDIRRQFYSIEELIKLIERAREAGMSDEELGKLELRDGDKVINVQDYITEERLRRLRKEEKLREFLSKKFLTVNDIYGELIKSEPEVIEKLREELVSER